MTATAVWQIARMKIIKRIKKFYSYENEWKTWSDKDKLYWTITFSIIGIIFLLTL